MAVSGLENWVIFANGVLHASVGRFIAYQASCYTQGEQKPAFCCLYG